MTEWLLLILFLGVFSLLATFLILRSRRRKRERLELRLRSGRQQLLGEEIELRMRDLQDISQEELDSARARAEEVLDQLHVLLLERQGHLINYEDLTRLQQVKVDILSTRARDLEEATESVPALSPSPDPPPPAPEQNRAQKENQMLEKIRQLQKGQSE